MAIPKRVYEVIERASNKVRLIEAATPAQARSFVARQAYDVRVPSAAEVAQLFQTGAVAKVERAGEDDAQ